MDQGQGCRSFPFGVLSGPSLAAFYHLDYTGPPPSTARRIAGKGQLMRPAHERVCFSASKIQACRSAARHVHNVLLRCCQPSLVQFSQLEKIVTPFHDTAWKLASKHNIHSAAAIPACMWLLVQSIQRSRAYSAPSIPSKRFPNFHQVPTSHVRLINLPCRRPHHTTNSALLFGRIVPSCPADGQPCLRTTISY